MGWLFALAILAGLGLGNMAADVAGGGRSPALAAIGRELADGLGRLTDTRAFLPPRPVDAGGEAWAARRFSTCHSGGGVDCVVDGDTFWMAKQGGGRMKVRIADIDTPETHPPRCEREAELGDRATERLREWLSAGAFTLEDIDRAEDRYGRRLAVVTRDGRSVGDTLIAEGLARPWTGRRQPWC